MYVIAALFSVAFLIVVHEAGHYFIARRCGMRVERFSIGFGPGIFKRVSKKTGTTFQIAPIPFGGFVEIRGMNIAEDVDPRTSTRTRTAPRGSASSRSSPDPPPITCRPSCSRLRCSPAMA